VPYTSGEPIELHFGPIADAAAGTAVTQAVWQVPKPAELKALKIWVSANVTANATDYATISVKKGTTTIASRATSAEGLTANTPVSLTLPADANKFLAAGDMLILDIAHSGLGAAINGLTLQLSLEWLQA